MPPAGQGEGWEFSQADLQAANRPVRLDLGNYQAAVGIEVEIVLVLDSPPLESLTLIMAYDPAALEYVPESAGPVGGVFRRGIEFHADPATGCLALIHAGVPGQKNLLAAKNEKVVAFRMRARSAGTTQLRVVEDQSSFTNGSGANESLTVTGGRVVIR